jgi:hypothetical protein
LTGRGFCDGVFELLLGSGSRSRSNLDSTLASTCGERIGVTFLTIDSVAVGRAMVSRFVFVGAILVLAMLFSTDFSDRGFLVG